MSTQQKKLARRLKKGSLPKFAENLDVGSLSDSHCIKTIKDIAKYDKDNKQYFGGKRRRSTKRRRTKRRSTKRRRTKRRRTKRRRRKR